MKRFTCFYVDEGGINPKPYTPHLVLNTPFCLMLFSPHGYSNTQCLKEKKEKKKKSNRQACCFLKRCSITSKCAVLTFILFKHL